MSVKLGIEPVRSLFDKNLIKELPNNCQKKLYHKIEQIQLRYSLFLLTLHGHLSGYWGLKGQIRLRNSSLNACFMKIIDYEHEFSSSRIANIFSAKSEIRLLTPLPKSAPVQEWKVCSRRAGCYLKS